MSALRSARRAAHRATTAHIQSAYPFIAEGGLSGRGAYIGRDQYGCAWCYDPWELYDQGLISSPNAIVVGEIGSAKSSLAKTLLYRQVGVFGRRGWVIDPKGEYGPLADALGATPLRLEPGGHLRLNPLGGGRPEGRAAILLAVAAAALARKLTPEEEAGTRSALEAIAQSAREPTLPEVVGALHEPGEATAGALHTSRAELAGACREVALALDGLCHGPLAGMFDGQTSPDIDLTARLVVLDLSAMYGDQALGILMTCATAALRATLDAEAARGAPRQTILVVDEGWRVFAHLGIGEWLQSTWKLSRALGMAGVAVMHRISDLTAAGDSGTREVKLAEGLLADAQTRIVYRQSPDELERSAHLLGLTDTEAELVAGLASGQAIWKVGARSGLVAHRLSAVETELVNTDARMGRASQRGGRSA
ncbi:MAG: ATP-binding protein [Solirubrobacteraceae bacterium]